MLNFVSRSFVLSNTSTLFRELDDPSRKIISMGHKCLKIGFYAYVHAWRHGEWSYIPILNDIMWQNSKINEKFNYFLMLCMGACFHVVYRCMFVL